MSDSAPVVPGIRTWPGVAVRVALVGLLVAVYVVAWRPARDVLAERLVAPALQHVETERSRSFAVAASGRSVTIRRPGPPAPVLTLRVPAGILFVLSGALLLALYPTRPYWLYLWAYQMGLGAVSVGLLALGLAWTDGAFSAVRVLSGPFYMGTSLAAPLVAYGVRSRRLGTALEGGAASTEG